jgi:hypothetical protein
MMENDDNKKQGHLDKLSDWKEFLKKDKKTTQPSTMNPAEMASYYFTKACQEMEQNEDDDPSDFKHQQRIKR